ncbi:MAG: ammonia monooxygenase [Ramlibacter sp.]|nr:ammonia monooxygenase [Ramlibacter sp.]
MGQLSRFLRSLEGGGMMYWCQGCKSTHAVNVGQGPGPRWGYNGNPDAPTFTPSVLVTWYEPTAEGEAMMDRGDPLPPGMKRYPGKDMVCHTFIRDGRVQFLSDCTHELAGQTLDLPELPAHLQDSAP